MWLDDQLRDGFQRYGIPLGTLTHNLVCGYVSDHGGVAKGFPLGNVGNVDFDDRDVQQQQGISDGDAGMGISCRVDDQSGTGADGLLDPVDDITFMIGLKRFDGHPHGFAQFLEF